MGSLIYVAFLKYREFFSGGGGVGRGEGGRGKGEGGGEVVMKWCNGEWWSGGGCPEICMWKFNASITFHDN